MSRFKYQSYAQDGNGSIIISATVKVYLTGTSTAADVYTASSGGTAVNQVTSDSNGKFYFWVDDGDYTGEQFFRVVISKTSFSPTTLDDIIVLPELYAGTGTTANRPTVTKAGMYYIDTDLGQVVFWDGSAWTLFTLVSDPAPKLSTDLDLDGNGLIYTGTTVVTAAELGHLDGVTSAIQTQIDTKAPIADPTFTGEIGIGAVNVSETELGILEGATVTTAEVNYSDGVTSAIQTQLDNKALKAWIFFDGTGTIAIKDSYNVASITDNGTGDYTITWDTDFADTNYAWSGASGGARFVGEIAKATGTLRVGVYDTAGALTDNAVVCVMATGAQ